MNLGGGSKLSAKGSKKSFGKRSEDSLSTHKKKKKRVARSCCCGEPTTRKETQATLRRYDPHDHRLGYVTVCKPQNYTSPTASRQYDKFKVVAECLNLESVDLFNSQKFVARHHYPPEVCEFFWDSHNPGELLHKATQIRVLATLRRESKDIRISIGTTYKTAMATFSQPPS